MKIKQIFLDLDDVLNRCTMSALAYVGCPVEAFDDSTYKPEWGWDIVRAANALHPSKTFTKESFWGCIDRRFWAHIPRSYECDWLLDTCAAAVDSRNVHILTTPIDDSNCLAGKLDWIHRFLPKWMHRQYVMSVDKYLCASPDSLLIDDRDKNVQDFRDPPSSRLYGGQAILMPRPWNSLHRSSSRLPAISEELIREIK